MKAFVFGHLKHAADKNPAYAVHLEGISPEVPKPACIHLGAATGELQPCPPPSLCRAKVFACAHAEHGPTTTIRKCSACNGWAAKVG